MWLSSLALSIWRGSCSKPLRFEIENFQRKREVTEVVLFRAAHLTEHRRLVNFVEIRLHFTFVKCISRYYFWRLALFWRGLCAPVNLLCVAFQLTFNLEILSIFHNAAAKNLNIHSVLSALLSNLWPSSAQAFVPESRSIDDLWRLGALKFQRLRYKMNQAP